MSQKFHLGHQESFGINIIWADTHIHTYISRSRSRSTYLCIYMSDCTSQRKYPEPVYLRSINYLQFHNFLKIKILWIHICGQKNWWILARGPRSNSWIFLMTKNLQNCSHANIVSELLDKNVKSNFLFWIFLFLTYEVSLNFLGWNPAEILKTLRSMLHIRNIEKMIET